MRKAIIRGTGSGGEKTTAYINANNAVFDVEIIGYSDGNPQKWGGYFLDKRIYSPGELEDLDYDILVIGSGMYHEIRKELLSSGVPEDKVYSWHELYTEYQYQKKYGCTGKKKGSGDPLSDLVVYTANMGNYDDLPDPLFTDGQIRYVCFTDDPDFHSEIWEVHPVDPGRFENPVIAGKFYKFFPDKLFPEHKWSVWVDSKFRILTDLREYIRQYLREAPMLCFPHFERDCIYDEMVECISEGKGDPVMLGGQVYHYYKEGYPSHNGIYEGGCIVRRHHDADLKELMGKWWDEVHKFSTRDQISLPYLCWKQGFRIDISDLDLYHCKYFKFIGHK